MINKKYLIMLVLMSVLLIVGSLAYVLPFTSKISLLNSEGIRKNEGSSINGDLIIINKDVGGGSSSGISGLVSFVGVQNLENPGIFLFQGFIGEDFDFSIEFANTENETEQPSSEYSAEFFNAENNLLKVFNFSAEEIEYSDYKMFYFFAEIPLETKKIVFYKDYEALSDFMISEHSPVVSNVEVDEVEENEVEIRWEAEDVDEDILVFSVFISNGDESYIVGAAVKSNNFTLNTGFIQEGNYKIIVRSFDGFNFGYGESDFFPVGEKKPYLMIFGVVNNSEFLFGEEIYASASGFDLEDGFLNNFSWKLNGEFVNSGSFLTLSNLSLEEYELTLEAEDSDENTETLSVKFFVVETLNTWCNNVDINQDGVVDANDYDILDRTWLFYRNSTCSSDNAWCNGADINRDSRIDANDYDRIDKTYLFSDDSGRCMGLF